MALYRLKIFLASGNDISPFANRIIAEMDSLFKNGKYARNPKVLRERRFDPAGRCIVADIYSKAELASPGHLISNVSKSLLKSEEKICEDLREELSGKRLFKIDSEKVSYQKQTDLSDYKFLQIISALLLEEVGVKEKHQNEEIIRELKKILLNNQYIVSEFELEDK